MRVLAILSLMLVASCGQSFDERYDEAEKQLEAKAAEMDRQLHTEGVQTQSAEDQDDGSP